MGEGGLAEVEPLLAQLFPHDAIDLPAGGLAGHAVAREHPGHLLGAHRAEQHVLDVDLPVAEERTLLRRAL